MARIARRGLRLQGLPLLSLPSPWRSVADAAGTLAVGGDEPGCLELARRVESPGSPGFGYAEAAERRGGGVGMLVQAQQVRWLDPAVSGCQAVHLTGHGVRSFRILSLRKRIPYLSPHKLASQSTMRVSQRLLLLFLLAGARAEAAVKPWLLRMFRSPHRSGTAPNQTNQPQSRERMERLHGCLERFAREVGIGHGGLSCCNYDTVPPLQTSLGATRQYSSEAAAQLLRGRNVVFMGDSTVSAQMQYLVCLLHESEDYTLELDPARGHSDSYIHHGVRFPSSNITLEFIGTGRRWSKMRPFSLEQVLPEKVTSLRPADVVIVNSGLHDNTADQMRNASVRIATTVAETVASCRSKSSPCPKIFWRETTPTHFATLSGNWIDPEPGPQRQPMLMREVPPEGQRGKPVHCHRLNDTKKKMWSNFRNDMTNPILAKAGVRILKSFDALADLHQEHCGGSDCLHGSMVVYDFLIMDTLAELHS